MRLKRWLREACWPIGCIGWEGRFSGSRMVPGPVRVAEQLSKCQAHYVDMLWVHRTFFTLLTRKKPKEEENKLLKANFMMLIHLKHNKHPQTWFYTKADSIFCFVFIYQEEDRFYWDVTGWFFGNKEFKVYIEHQRYSKSGRKHAAIYL